MSSRDVVAEKYNLPLPPTRSVLSSKVVTDRFIEGLVQHDLTLEEIQSGDWRYCGGETGHRQKDFHLSQPGREPPNHEDECVCGHLIRENCYITNGDRVIVLGNVCVKRFLPPEKSGRNCSDCGCRHNNLKVDLCNVCRKLR